MDEKVKEATEYMTNEEVAALYRVTVKTVYRWRMAGRLKGVRAGRRWLYRAEDVAKLAEPSGAE